MDARDQAIATEIRRIRDLVRRNTPRHHDPEAFHEQKSEITGALTRLLDRIERGGAVETRNAI